MVGDNRTDVDGGLFAAPRAPEGLEGPASALPWLGLSLGARQERAFLEAGLRWCEQPADERARVLVRADVAVTGGAVQEFLRLAAGSSEDISWSASGRFGSLVEELSFGRAEPLLVWLAPGGEATWERLIAARPLDVDPKERLIQLPFPTSAGGADLIEIPLSDRIVMPAGHWLQLLWANLLGLPPFLWRTLAGRNVVEVAWHIAGAWIRAASFDPMRVGARLGRRGRGCRVHPSAVVEGCWLGDGVQIGANAVVRGSVLADGAAVEDLALVEGCVLGAGARVQRLGMCKFTLVGERAAVGGNVQLGVLDKGAALKKTASMLDQAFGQDVRVRVEGQAFAVPLGIAGSCVGARTVVGANVSVAPGRVLPPDLQVVADPASVVRSIPTGLSGLVVVRDGRLEAP